MIDTPHLPHIQRGNKLVDDGWLSRLPGTQLKVWLVFHRYANDKDSGSSFRAQSDLAADLGLADTKGVQNAIRALVELGLLEVQQASTQRKAARFRVCVPNSGPTSGLANPEGVNFTPSQDVRGGENDPLTGGEIHPVRGGQNDPPINVLNNVEINVSEKEMREGENDLALAEAIYNAYPRKTGREKGLRAISDALQKLNARGQPPDGCATHAEWLRGRTVAYAAERKAVVERDANQARYTPYPATWFNDGGYLETPASRQQLSKTGSNAPSAEQTRDEQMNRRSAEAEIAAHNVRCDKLLTSLAPQKYAELQQAALDAASTEERRVWEKRSPDRCRPWRLAMYEVYEQQTRQHIVPAERRAA